MPSLLCLHFTVSLVAVFFVVAVTCFVVCLNMLWHFAEMCVKGFKPLKSTSLSVCVFFFLFHNTCLLLPRCPDGYFGPRCLQTEPLRVYMPNPFKSMFKWYEQLTTETQLSLDYLCGLLLPSSSPPTPQPPPDLFLFLLLFLLLRSTRIELCTTPCTRWCHPKGTLCFCCL